MAQRGVVAAPQVDPAAVAIVVPAHIIAVDVVAAQRGIGAGTHIDPAAVSVALDVVHHIAVDTIFAQRDGGADDVHPAAGIIRSPPAAAAQPARVAAGDAQPFDRDVRRIAGDIDHPSLSLGVQRGRVGVRVRCAGKVAAVADGGGIAAPDGDALADIDHLSNAGPLMDRVIDIGRHEDLVVIAGRVHGILDDGIVTAAQADGDGIAALLRPVHWLAGRAWHRRINRRPRRRRGGNRCGLPVQHPQQTQHQAQTQNE